ncbi:TonB-dependent receptor [Vibrio sp.]|uniref:TonB-dependent receptor n=1 Tax=Vibrio sp. TaxID=678 RepID=UPI003D0F4DB0
MDKSILAVTVASLLSYTSLSHAAQADSQETMLVIGRSEFNNSIENIPANVVVLTSDEIAASGATDLSGLLRGRAGIQISDTNSGPVFAMRGFSGGQAGHNTLILLDGRRLNKQDLSSPQLSSILISQIERVEILSGSAGVLYGDQAVGGVINIITKSGQGERGHVSIGAGNYDSFAGSAGVSTDISDDWRLYLSASQDNSDNYRQHNRRETGVLLGRVSYQRDLTEFYTEASYYDNNRQYAGSLSEQQYQQDPRQASSPSNTDYSHDITKAVRIGYKQPLQAGWSLDSSAFYDRSTASGLSYGSDTKKSSRQLEGAVKLENRFNNQRGAGNLLIGLDGADRSHQYLASFSNRDNDQSSYSIYSQFNYPLLEKLTLTLGGRYSAVEDRLYDMAIYPNRETLTASKDAYEAALNYKINAEQRAYLRADTNFRFAKIDEQAYTSPGVRGLKPQTGRSIEAGWSLMKPSYSVKLDLFQLALEDEIIFDSSAPTPIGGFFQGANVNAESSERRGATWSGDLYLLEDWLLGAEYSFIDAEFTNGVNQGKELPWVARHSGRLFSNFDVSEHWQLFVEGVYTGSRYKDGDTANSAAKLPAYWLGNLAVNYTRQAWTASLRVDNLFDQKYAANANNWGAYYPGDGRRFMLTGRYQF